MSILVIFLIEALGSPTFSHREAAAAALGGIIEYAAPALLVAESHPDPEIRQRASNLLRPWFVTHADELSRTVKAPHGRKLPWLCLDGCYDSETVNTYLARAKKNGVDGMQPGYEMWREACRLWLVAMIARRLPYIALLKEMYQAELQWHAGNR